MSTINLQPKRWVFLPLLVGLLLRLGFLNKHEFWFDEEVSLHIIGESLPSLLSMSATTSTPPLYFLLLNLWSSISLDISYLRSLSVIFGAASIFISYKVFSKLTSRRVAYFASLLFALSPLSIYFSTEIRMYAILVFATLLLVWFFLRYKETKKNLFLLAIFITGSVAIHTHYYAVLVILSLNVVFFLSKKLRSQIKPWLISQALIALAVLPWFLYALKVPSLECWCFSPLLGIPATIASNVVGGVGLVTLRDYAYHAPKAALWFFVVATIIVTLFFLIGAWKTWVKKNLTLIILFFVPLGIAAFVGLFYPVFSPRALIIISPYFYLFVSIGLFSLMNGQVKSLSKIIIPLLLIVILVLQFLNPFFGQIPKNKPYLQPGNTNNILAN